MPRDFLFPAQPATPRLPGNAVNQVQTSGQISRLLRRLRLHGLIKKVGRTYKSYVTGLGKQVVALGLKLKQLCIIPALSPAPAR